MGQHKQAKYRLLAYMGTLAIVAASTSGYALASEQSLDDPQSSSTAVDSPQSDESTMSELPALEDSASSTDPESESPQSGEIEDEEVSSSEVATAPESYSPRTLRASDALSECSYADEGSGAYAQSLCWIDMSGLTTRYSTVISPVENTTCSYTEIWPFRQYTCVATGRFSSDLGSQYGIWERSFSRTASSESAARSAVINEFESALSQSQEIYRDSSGNYWGSIRNYPIDIPLTSSLSFTASVNISLNQESLSSRGLAIAANVIPLGAWAGLGNHGVYTGITGKPALEHQINGTTQTVTDVALSSIKLVNTKTGASVKDFSMVTADAEVTTAGEKITWSHTGGNGFTWLPNDPDAWTAATSNEARKNAAVGNGCQGTAASAFSADSNTVSTSTKTCDGGSATGARTGSAMLQISPNSTAGQFSVTQTMWGGGNEGIAFGILTARAQVNVEVAERIVDTSGLPSQTAFQAQLIPNSGDFGQDDAVTASTGNSATSASEDMTVPAATGEGKFQFDIATPNITEPYFSSYTPNWTCSKTTSQSRIPIPWPQNGTELAPRETPPSIGEEWMRLGPGEFLSCTVTYIPPISDSCQRS